MDQHNVLNIRANTINTMQWLCYTLRKLKLCIYTYFTLINENFRDILCNDGSRYEECVKMDPKRNIS